MSECIYDNSKWTWWYKHDHNLNFTDGNWSYNGTSYKAEDGGELWKWWWYLNDNKEKEGYFTDGKRNGLWTWWYDTGLKKSEGSYLDDEQDGLWLYYNPDESIGEEIGIYGPDDLSIHGTELRDMDDDQLDSILDRVAIFSRTTTDQKLRIVSRLQHLGHVVAMTGDGDNDAPALSKSNIGISMGRAGTDVARDASDMVLQDDDFSSIVKAVDEGRRIYQNIRNFVRYQISTNVAAVLLLLVTTMLMDWTFPFTVTQLLVINILMDGPPAVALGVEQQAKDVMKEPPRPLDETLPTSTDAALILFLGMIMVIGTASVFYFAGGAIIDSTPCSTGPAGGDDYMINGVCNEDAWLQNAESQFAIAQTSAFAAFIFFQLMNVMNCRSSEVSAFRLGITSNSWITISILISTSMLLLFVHAPEIAGFRIGEMVHTVPLKPLDWLVVFAVASSVFVAEEMRKMLWPKPKK